jgi:hypothetical protein
MKCKECNTEINRNDQRHEKWRLYRRGYGKKDAGSILPRCHKCLSEWIHENHKDFPPVGIVVQPLENTPIETSV